MRKKRKLHHPKHSIEDSLNLKIGEKVKRRIEFGLIAVILVVILLIFLIFFLGLKIRFTLSDELNLILLPKYQSITVLSNETASAGFTIKNQNFIQCRSVCNFTLTSLRDNTDIYFGSEQLKHNEKVEKNITFYAPAFGSGQDLYIYRVECRNIKSLLCLTEGDSRKKTSVIAINYELDENEKSIKANLKTRIEELFLVIKNLSISVEQARLLYDRLPYEISEKEEIMRRIDEASEELEGIKSSAGVFKSLWDSEDYYTLNSSFNSNILIRAGALARDIPIEEELAALALWNNNMELLLKIGGQRDEITRLFDFLTNETLNEPALSQLNQILIALIDDYKEIISGTNISQHHLNADIATSLQNIKDMISQSEKTKNGGLFLIAYSNAKIETKLNSTAPELNGTICSRLNQTIREILKENEKSVRLREAQYNWSLNNSNFSREIQEISEQIDYISLLRAEKETGTAGYYESNSISEFASSFNISQAEFYMLATLNVSAEQEYMNKNCFAFPSQINSSPMEEFLSIDFASLAKEKEELSLPLVTADYVTELKENEERCCTFNECSRCLNSSDDSPIPVIFIHGHPFNEKNTPEYAMNAFTKLQTKLEEEKIINFGELGLGEDPGTIAEGEWSKSNRSVTVRASYYYISHYNVGSYDVTVQKSERIENYAIRLKEIIDLVKYRTGAPRVSIIAHSMGGLVVREYGVLFGYESLDKVILINTPNKGITKKIGRFCQVFGSQNECADMTEGSIFLNKLNSHKIPEKPPFYAIRSIGCKMENNSQGDGIVTEESAYLEGAMNIAIQGECLDKLQTDLHTSVLDPELHPETYEFIRDILLGKIA